MGEENKTNAIVRTSLKMTMAVAVSWGLFVGASITGHASEDTSDLPDNESKASIQEPASQEPAPDQPEPEQPEPDQPEPEQPEQQPTQPVAEQPQPETAQLMAAMPETPAQSMNLLSAPASSITESSMQPVDLDDLDDNTDDAQEETRRVTLAILSDTHYVADEQKTAEGKDNLDHAAQTEMRLIEEIDGIITTTLDQVSDEKPDCLLVCGDLSSNGEYSGARALADKLNAVKEADGMEDVGIYVVNGNHDINNSYAADLSNEDIEAAQRVSPEDFKTIYSGLGYGENDHCEGGSRAVYNPADDDPSKAQNHGGLSYATDIAEGVRLIVMDTGIYSYEDLENSRYGDAQKTAGYVSEGLLDWVVQQSVEAKDLGKLVLAMCHHSVMPHYTIHNETMDAYMAEFVIGNSNEVCNALADAGVSAVLTGHSHANDIAKFVSDKGNVLYDIQTAALCAYPVAWRTVTIDITGSGKEAVYEFSIDTTFLDEDFEGVDTSKWKVKTGNTQMDFMADYDGSMQKYSYDKSGMRAEAIEPIVDYMVRPILYDIAKSDEGLEGYLREKLEIPQSKGVGNYASEKIKEALGNFDDFSADFSGYTFSVKQEAPSGGKYNFSVKLTGNDADETGSLVVDLSGIAAGVDNTIATLNGMIRDGDWIDSNYAASPLQKEINKLLAEVLTEALKKPLDPDDPASTGFNIANDAMQAFAKGNEGIVQTEQRARWQELLKGENFNKTVKDAILSSLIGVTQSSKPLLYQALSESMAPEDGQIINLTSEGTLLSIFGSVLNSVTNVNDFLGKLAILKMTGVNPVPDVASQKITGMLAEMQLALTVDTNIPQDADWEFHTVLFYPENGTKNIVGTLTIEDYRAGYFPKVSRSDYKFTGWYTVSGELVTPETDLSEIFRLYARWQYIGGRGQEDDYHDDIIVEADTDNSQNNIFDEYITDGDDTFKISDYVSYVDDMAREISIINESLLITGDYTMAISGTGSAGTKIMVAEPSIFNNTLVDQDGYEITSTIFIAPDGRIVVNFKNWKYLSPEMIKALDSCEKDIEVYFYKNGKLCRFFIPRRTKIAKLADRSGFIGIQYLENIMLLLAGGRTVQL